MTGREHPTLGRPYSACAYLPMLELLRHLEANGFTTLIASGGDRDFMRSIGDELYGIPPERVVGSSNALAWHDDESGGAITYLAQPDVFDDGPGKAGADLEPDGPPPAPRSGQLERRHPDARLGGRRAAGAPAADRPRRRRARVRLRDGRRGRARAARADGWTVVSIRRDWSAVFAT